MNRKPGSPYRTLVGGSYGGSNRRSERDGTTTVEADMMYYPKLALNEGSEGKGCRLACVPSARREGRVVYEEKRKWEKLRFRNFRLIKTLQAFVRPLQTH